MNKVLGMNINKFAESLRMPIVNYSSCVFLFFYQMITAPGLLAFLQMSFFLQLKCGARGYHATIIRPHNVIIFSQEFSATHVLVYKLNLSSEKRNQQRLPVGLATIRKR